MHSLIRVQRIAVSRPLLALALAVLALGAWATQARAATLSMSSGQLVWASTVQFGNNVVDLNYNDPKFTSASYSLTSHAEETQVSAGTPCGAARTVAAGTPISCEPTGISSWFINFWNGTDALRTGYCPPGPVICFGLSKPPVPLKVWGWSGDDVLEGGTNNDEFDSGFEAEAPLGNDTIDGAAGNDVLNGGVTDGGGDKLFGGPGDDLVTPGAGNDTIVPGIGDDGLIDGGEGVDSVSYADGRGNGVAVSGTGSEASPPQNDGGVDDDADPAQREAILNVERLIGTPAADSLDTTAMGLVANRLEGAGGPDTLLAGNGNDSVFGGEGDDTVAGGFGDDELEGEGGTDMLEHPERSTGQAVTISLDGVENDGAVAEKDEIGTGFEGVAGGGGADVLLGGPGANSLLGGAGGDTIDGLGGADVIRGGLGREEIEARDGVADDVDCGPDEDSAFTDAIDSRVDCDPPPLSSPAEPSVPGPAGQAASPQRLLPRVAFVAEPGQESTLLKRLRVLSLPAGSTLTAACTVAKRRKCPGIASFRKIGPPPALRLKSFEGKALPVGSRVEIRVTRSGAIGAAISLRMRKAKKPSLSSLCLPPGSAVPVRC